MKKHTLILSLFFVFLAQFSVSAKSQNPINLWINGQYIQSDVPLYIKDNRTMTPLRVISENLGYNVKWDEAKRQVLLSRSSDPAKTVRLVIGDKRIHNAEKVIGKPVTLDTAPEIRSDRTFIPLRAVAELFGHRVDWDNPARTVVIGEGYRTPFIHPLDKRYRSLTLDGKSLGPVVSYSKDGILYVSAKDLAKSLGYTLRVEQCSYSDEPGDLSITLTGPNNWAIKFDVLYIKSTDGLNFGGPNIETYQIEESKLFLPLNFFADARHMDYAADNAAIQLYTNSTKDIYPFDFQDPENEAIRYRMDRPCVIHWNGTNYTINFRSKDGNLGRSMDFNSYMDYMQSPNFEEDFKDASPEVRLALSLGRNSHFFFDRLGHVVYGMIGG